MYPWYNITNFFLIKCVLSDSRRPRVRLPRPPDGALVEFSQEAEWANSSTDESMLDFSWLVLTLQVSNTFIDN